MYCALNGDVVKVSVVSGKDNLATLSFSGQNDIQTVLNCLSTEIRLYNDVELTQLAAVYNQVEVQRATLDLKATVVSVMISASRLTDLETEQLKQDIANEQSAGGDRDEALTELAGMIADLMDAMAELGDTAAALDARVTALENK